MSNLLAQIAQGWTGNPAGMYAQGQQQQRQNRLSDLQMEKAQMELSAMPAQNALANTLSQLKIREAEAKLKDPRLGATYGKSIAGWGKDSNGKPVPLILNDRGSLEIPSMPGGITEYMEPLRLTDFGGYYQGIGGRSGQPLTPEMPKGLPPEKQPQNILNAAEAEDTADVISSSREKLNIITNMNSNYDEAIRLSQGGANTGPIDRLLPTFKAQTAALDHLQKEMGLDIIGAVTFGALSQSEMDIAMQTALPTNLNGPQLVQWLQRKKTANQKLSKYLQKQIAFLRGGGTIEKWIAKQEAGVGGSPQPATPKPGTIEDGYRFIGGDPADPKRWVKVK